MTEATDTHGDAERLAAIEQGLPPDVHDHAMVEAYQALQRPAAMTKAASPKPTKKGG